MNDVLQVLMYFFEKIENELPLYADEEMVFSGLVELGVAPDKVQRIIDWMGHLIKPQKQIDEYPLQAHAGIRVFTPLEITKLSNKCRSFLLNLEQIGVLTSATRELIIDQLMKLNAPAISLSRLKWVALMVLSNEQDKTAIAYMERYLLSEGVNLH